jgi:hypothetical protein
MEGGGVLIVFWWGNLTEIGLLEGQLIGRKNIETDL